MIVFFFAVFFLFLGLAFKLNWSVRCTGKTRNGTKNCCNVWMQSAHTRVFYLNRSASVIYSIDCVAIISSIWYMISGVHSTHYLQHRDIDCVRAVWTVFFRRVWNLCLPIFVIILIMFPFHANIIQIKHWCTFSHSPSHSIYFVCVCVRMYSIWLRDLSSSSNMAKTRENVNHQTVRKKC